MVLILILARLAVKSALKLKESVILTSREGGCFLSTLNFAHASDCRFLWRSASGISVAFLMSYKRSMGRTNHTGADVEKTDLIGQEVVQRKVLEEEEYDSSIRGDVDGVFSRLESRYQICISQGGLPC
jgi:hypothetical protein